MHGVETSAGVVNSGDERWQRRYAMGPAVDVDDDDEPLVCSTPLTVLTLIVQCQHSRIG